MSTITFTCPHCQSQTNFPSTAVGQQGKCSGCLQNVTIQLDPTPPATNPAAKKKLIIFATVGCGAVVVLGLALLSIPLLIWSVNKNARDDGLLTEQPVESRDRPAEPADNLPTEQPVESITNAIGMTLNKIPAGTFLMGSPETEPDRESAATQHKVTITKAFYMQTTEVTQGQWRAVMGTEPWKGEDDVKEGPDYPATNVSWHDAVAYCKKLSAQEAKTYRLPTEAEWEYACRAGTETRWSFGNDENKLGDYAWYYKNALDIDEEKAHQVGLKKPNAFGLYDVHGNVLEWCHDYFGEDYYKQSPEKDPTGPAQGSSHVMRGGSWWYNSRQSGSAYRFGVDAGHPGYDDGGFRLVRELD
jgi:sulfatase modifying factor 1